MPSVRVFPPVPMEFDSCTCTFGTPTPLGVNTLPLKTTDPNWNQDEIQDAITSNAPVKCYRWGVITTTWWGNFNIIYTLIQ